MADSKTLRGTALAPAARAAALASFVHRNTVENRAAHPITVACTGCTLPPITDEQWLAITDFPVTEHGHLVPRCSCYTHNSEIPEHAAILAARAAQRAAELLAL